jgi:hypothetical protein
MKGMKAFCSVIALASLGIAGGCRTGSPAAEAQKGTPVLRQMLSRTDRVIVKNFYTPMPLAEEAQGGLTPGFAKIGGVWVYPAGDRTHGERGGSIELRSSGYYSDGTIPHGFEHAIAYLDLGEMQDLDTSLTYFAGTRSVWNLNSSAKEVEADFATKDGLSVSAFTVEHKPVVFLSDGSAQVEIPFDRIGEIQSAVRNAIKDAQSEQ